MLILPLLTVKEYTSYKSSSYESRTFDNNLTRNTPRLTSVLQFHRSYLNIEYFRTILAAMQFDVSIFGDDFLIIQVDGPEFNNN
jgi:hypothetical protein